MSLRCWYVSGRMSRMKGGLFFRFSFGLWQSFTTYIIDILYCPISKFIILGLIMWLKENKTKFMQN